MAVSCSRRLVLTRVSGAAQRQAKRNGALQTRDRFSLWRSRISDAPLRWRSRCVASGTHDTDSHSSFLSHDLKQTRTSSFPRRIFRARGFASFASPTPNRGVGGAPRNVRVRAKHPLGLHMTRQARRLRGALRPMTQQDTGRNNITISTMDGGSVPIVSQTEIEPMKTALSFCSRSSRRRRLIEPLPVPKRPGLGGSCSHGYIASRSFCAPSQGAADGTCPWGWIESGSYCLRSGRRG